MKRFVKSETTFITLEDRFVTFLERFVTQEGRFTIAEIGVITSEPWFIILRRNLLRLWKNSSLGMEFLLPQRQDSLPQRPHLLPQWKDSLPQRQNSLLLLKVSLPERKESLPHRQDWAWFFTSESRFITSEAIFVQLRKYSKP